jgi:hypothetical protein
MCVPTKSLLSFAEICLITGNLLLKHHFEGVDKRNTELPPNHNMLVTLPLCPLQVGLHTQECKWMRISAVA